ncbi:MAG TPA: RHS repeat-associated core domain-containing protein [Candidatus Acidoferrum sp.]|jgi:RHS repeat-associated protein
MSRTLRPKFLLLPLLLAIFVSAASTRAQGPATGTPPFSTTMGWPDVIDVSNLNVHWTIPVFHKAGRGTNFSYDLGYDSLVWSPVTSGSLTSWQPTNNFGWMGQTQVPTGQQGYMQVTGTTTTISCPLRIGFVFNWFYFYHDSFGAVHAFPGSSQTGGCPPQTPIPLNATSPDGSGYSISATGLAPTTKVTTRSGRVLFVQTHNQSSSTTSVTDPNGNQISVDASGNFTDTLGGIALSITGSGTATSPTVFNYPSPAGSQAAVTMKYSNFTIQTAFGCSGISDYGPTVTPLVSEVDLPDGTKYTFAYEATPGAPSNVTGRLKSVTLPTGGIIQYSYTGGSGGNITCTDGSAPGLARNLAGNIWTYVRTPGTGAASSTKVTDPHGNDSLLQFQGLYETQRQIYQGSSTSGTLLSTTTTCYNSTTTNCPGTAINIPIIQRTLTTQLGSGGLQSQQIHSYNAYGLETEEDDYDFASGTPTVLLRKTLITYASLGNGIVDHVASRTIQDGSGTQKSQTSIFYDETATVSPVNTPTPQHVSISGSRGNATTIKSWVQGATTLNKTFTYFDTGNIQNAADVNGALTSYAFSSLAASCGNSFPTGILEPLSLSKGFTWNCIGGVQTSVSDENGKVTTTAWTDPDFWRPSSTTDPASAVANFSYPNAITSEAAMVFNAGISTVDLVATLDSLGRKSLLQKRQSPGSLNFDTTEMDYDADGHPNRTTLPYIATAGQTNSTAAATNSSFDALNRILQSTDSGGETVSYGYSLTQNDVLVTTTPAPLGENSKQRQYEYDALGRLISACELTNAAGSGTCGQHVSRTGFWTKYTYDALSNLTGVLQNAQAASAAQQTRTYAYDGLSRMISESNPESGTTTYTYDSATFGACAVTSKGDLIARTNALGISTCNAYDVMHRLTSVGHNPAQAASTPDRFYVYDAASVGGVTMSNTKGRLAEAYTCLSPCSKITDEGFSYSVRGELSDIYQSTPHSSGYYHVAQQYWENSSKRQISGIPGVPTITYGVDGEGRANQVSSASGQNPVTSITYNAASLPISVTYGSLDADSFGYDPSTNRLTQYKFTINSQSEIGNLTWNANHSLQSLSITDPFNATDTQNCAFTYDDLSRLASANCGSAWSQTFAYDAFGNISKSGTFSFLPIYQDVSGITTNRFVSIPGATVSYDASGNVLSDGSHFYTWDANAKPATVDSIAITYDALGRAVEQNRSGAFTQVVYGPAGNKLAIVNGSTLVEGLVPLPGGSIAAYNGAGLLYYGHPDHLGSIRLGSSPTRAVTFGSAYAPFGEAYAVSGSTDQSFTGQRQDTVAGLYDFPSRQYGIQGRWPKPDPSGLASVILRDPQTLNLYAYVRNSPTALTDPTGLSSKSVNISPMFRVAPVSLYADSGLVFGGGNDEFDAIAGAPGTFISHDMYGNASYGFSEDLYFATMNTIDGIRSCVTDSSCSAARGTHLPHDITDPGVYPYSGFQVNITNIGVFTDISGIVPDIAISEYNLNQAMTIAINEFTQQSVGLSPEDRDKLFNRIFGDPGFIDLIDQHASLIDTLLSIVLSGSPAINQ